MLCDVWVLVMVWVLLMVCCVGACDGVCALMCGCSVKMWVLSLQADCGYKTTYYYGINAYK